MTFQLSVPPATLASRCDGTIGLLMRVSSMVLCVFSLIASGVAHKLYAPIPTDGNGQTWSMILMITSGILILLTSIYLLVSLRLRIIYPVTITIELLSWLLAFAMAMAASLSTKWGLRLLCYGDCSDRRKVQPAVGTSCMLLFIDT